MVDRQKPLVYACSGCSNLAQVANDVAVVLDREGHAEMACIAGLGGDLPEAVSRARSGRPVWVIDGCENRCARSTLARHGVTPSWDILLTEEGLPSDAENSYGIQAHYVLLKRIYRELGIVSFSG